MLLLLTSAWATVALRNYGSLFDDAQSNPKFEIIFSETFIRAQEADELAALSEFVDPSPQLALPPTAATPPSDKSSLQPNSTASSTDTGANRTVEFVLIVRKARPHLCSIPRLGGDAVPPLDGPKTRSDRDKELELATTRGWELIAPLAGQCLHYLEGWFSYAFCFDTGVRQFHHLPLNRQNPWPPQEDTNHVAFVLGLIDPPLPDDDGRDDKNDDLGARRMGRQKADLRVPKVVSVSDTALYLNQKLEYGTVCDLTRQPRTIEIQYHCAPQVTQDRIGWIKETTTCNYQMAIYTQKLCAEEAFLPPKVQIANQIICREVLRDNEIAAWRARKAAEANGILNGLEHWNAQNQKRIIGGIELGAMKHSGRSGEPLEIVPRKKPAVSELLARGAPFGSKVEVLPAEELEKIELDPKAIEKLWQQLQAMAGERGWKLELVEDEANQGSMRMRAVVDEPAQEVEINLSGTNPESGQTKLQEENKPNDEQGSEETYKDEL